MIFVSFFSCYFFIYGLQKMNKSIVLCKFSNYHIPDGVITSALESPKYHY